MRYNIKRIIYSTYQAVSGAGKAGVEDLENGIKQLNQVLSSGDNKKIIEQLKNNMNK